MESADQKVWVKYVIGQPVEVSVPSECNVNGLKEIIKGKLSVTLKDYDMSQIYLHWPEEEHKERGGEYNGGEETAYDPDVLVSAIRQGGVGQTCRNPILIRTETTQAPAQIATASLDVYALASTLRTLLTPSNPATPTPATVGQQMLASIGKAGRDTTLEPKGSAAVLTDDQWERAKDCSSEGLLVKYLTPFLKSVLEIDGMCVVNSEDSPWLETNGAPQKPDLFVTSLWCYEKRKLAEKTAWKDNEGFRFGVVTDRGLYDNVYLLDAKCRCTPEALGELIIQLQHLAAPFGHAVVRGMLFGRSEFWLIECQGNELISRKTGTWTMPGSVQHIRDHFPRLLWCGIDVLCHTLEVEVVDPMDPKFKSVSAFLGIGGFGRVVKVTKTQSTTQSKDSYVYALKVVEKGNATVLATEHSMLQKHSAECPCNLLARPSSQVVETPDLCGYLLGPVGRCAVSRDMLSKSEISTVQVFIALRGLHVHSPPIIHGDPRIANLIVGTDESLFWIDLMRSQVGMVAEDQRVHFESDILTLLKSISPDLFPLSEPLRAAVEAYCHCLSIESIQAIVGLI